MQEYCKNKAYYENKTHNENYKLFQQGNMISFTTIREDVLCCDSANNLL